MSEERNTSEEMSGVTLPHGPIDPPQDMEEDDVSDGEAPCEDLSYTMRWESPRPHDRSRAREAITVEQTRQMLESALSFQAFMGIDPIIKPDVPDAIGLAETFVRLADDSEFISALNDLAIVDKGRQIYLLGSLICSMFGGGALHYFSINLSSQREQGKRAKLDMLADGATIAMLPVKLIHVVKSIDHARALRGEGSHWSFALSCILEAEAFTGVTDLALRRCSPDINEFMDELDDMATISLLSALSGFRASCIRRMLFNIAYGLVRTNHEVVYGRGSSRKIEVKVGGPGALLLLSSGRDAGEKIAMEGNQLSFQAMLRRGNVLSWITTHLHPGILLLLSEHDETRQEIFQELSPTLVSIAFERLAAAFPLLRQLGLALTDKIYERLIDDKALTGDAVLDLARRKGVGTMRWYTLFNAMGLA